MKIIIALNCDEIQVSDCDWLFLVGYNWAFDKTTGYYCCTFKEIWNGYQINSKPIHWFIAQLMGLKRPMGFEMDHINRDKSNNRRSNLRMVSVKLQNYNKGLRKDNKSGYMGVYFDSRRKKYPWSSRISMPNGKKKFLGTFATPEEASEAFQTVKKIRDEREIEKCSILTQKPVGCTEWRF